MAVLVKRRAWDDQQQLWLYRPQIEVIELTSKNLLTFTPQVFDEITGEPERSDWDITELPPEEWYAVVDDYEVLAGDGTTLLVVGDQFRNRDIGVIENGIYLGRFPVDNGGNVTLDDPSIDGSHIFVGFEYVGRAIPNRYQLALPTSQSQKIRWTKPVLRLFGSTMPLVNGVRARERASDDLYDTQVALFTGDVYIVNYGSDGILAIEQDVPLPFQMTGIFGLMTTEEG